MLKPYCWTSPSLNQLQRYFDLLFPIGGEGENKKEVPLALKTTTCGNLSLKLFTAALYFINGHILDVPRSLSFTDKCFIVKRARLSLALKSD